jgi:hypothetical protein
MIGEGDRGEIGGMTIGRGNQSTRRKPATAPLVLPLMSKTKITAQKNYDEDYNFVYFY